MKILHLISGGDSGGAKTHMFTLLDEQCSLADVTVACLMKGVFWRELQERTVKSVLFEQKHRFDISVCGKIADYIKSEKIDIVNVHGARANFVAALMKHRVSVPIVTTVHSDYLLDFDTPVKKLVFGGLNRLALRRIDYRIGVSDAFRDMLIERGFAPNTTYAVYNGINFTEAVPHTLTREEFAEKYGVAFEDGCVYIGIAARFDYVKGVDVFLDAAAKVLAEEKNVRFVIAGEGALEDELKEKAKSLGISERVHFIGFVSPIWDFLNFVDVNVLTSRCESFPYALLEGAKCRKATLASAVGGIPTLIRNGTTGLLFENEDADGCAACMLKYVRSSELRSSCADALYEKARAEFSNLALAKKYIENYSSIIGQYRRDKKYDVILSGYYGFDNYGDELILQTLIAAYRKAKPDIQLLVLSHDPKNTRLCCRTDSCGRFCINKIRKAMKKSKMYVNGGGTLLTDVTSKRSLRYYAFMLGMAKKCKLKTMLLANGIGPFNSESSKKTAMKALRGVDLITLRDEGTYEMITRVLPENEAVLTADLALISPYVLTDDETDDTAGDYFLVSVREWSGNAPGFEKTVADCCERICEKYSLRALLLPMQPQKDTEISLRIADMMKCGADVSRSHDSISSRARLIAGARFVLSMRLHPLICAAMNSLPAIALTYDDKVTNFMKEQSAGVIIGADTVTEKALLPEMEKAASGADAKSAEFTERMERVRKSSWNNIELSLDLLDR